jgi:hypothetical protein
MSLSGPAANPSAQKLCKGVDAMISAEGNPSD